MAGAVARAHAFSSASVRPPVHVPGLSPAAVGLPIPSTDVGPIDMRNIAPTLARLMHVPFPSAERPALDIKRRRSSTH